MLLYHGTKESTLTRILCDGIRPRAETGLKGNWKDCPSKPGFVYLTAAYALYFATLTQSEGNPVVLEIDTDRLTAANLFPDEDFMAEAILAQRRLGHLTGNRSIDRTEDARKLVKKIPLERFGEYFDLSVEKLGNAAHFGAIPPEAITRYIVLDSKKAARILCDSLNPSICTLNYMVSGAYYRNMLSFVFGDAENPPTARMEGVDVSALFPDYEERIRKVIETLRTERAEGIRQFYV